ncbi:hypothetical protein DIPPA_02526 [Diplonema papillatum]|nr:hypothetical protein DIPPA_02526 [Diplonema papillatum]
MCLAALCAVCVLGLLPDAAMQFRMSHVLLQDEFESLRPVAEGEGAQGLEKLQSGVAWLAASGAKLGAVKPSLLESTYTVGGDAGMVATADIAAGDVILSVPEKLLLTPDRAMAHVPAALLSLAKRAHFTASDALRLSLLYEGHRMTYKHKDGPWTPWVRSLWEPDPYLGKYTPSAKRVSAWKDNALYGSSADTIEQTRSQWTKQVDKLILLSVATGLAGFEGITDEASVRSASFLYDSFVKRVAFDAVKPHLPVFIPGLDYFKPRSGQTSWGYVPATNSIVLYAVQPISAGDQVFYDPGPWIRKSFPARFLVPAGLHSSWHAVFKATHLPLITYNDDPTNFYTAETTIRNMSAEPDWSYLLTLTSPPQEFLDALRLDYKHEVSTGAMSALEAEVKVFRTARDALLEEWKRPGEANITENAVRLATHRGTRIKRQSRGIQYQHSFVLRHNYLLLDFIAKYLESLLSATQPIGMALQAEELLQDRSVMVPYYRAVFGISVVMSRFHRLNAIRKAVGKPPLKLPSGHLGRRFDAELLDDMTGIKRLQEAGVLSTSKPPDEVSQQALFKALKHDIATQVSRSVLNRDSMLLDQLLKLGPRVANPNAYLAHGEQGRRRETAGHRLLHVAVQDGATQVARTLLLHGADSDLPPLFSKQPHYTASLTTDPVRHSLDLFRLLSNTGLIKNESAGSSGMGEILIVGLVNG